LKHTGHHRRLVAAVEVGGRQRKHRPNDAVRPDDPVVERRQLAVGQQMRPGRRHGPPVGGVPVGKDQPGGRLDGAHLRLPVPVQGVHPR